MTTQTELEWSDVTALVFFSLFACALCILLKGSLGILQEADHIQEDGPELKKADNKIWVFKCLIGIVIVLLSVGAAMDFYGLWDRYAIQGSPFTQSFTLDATKDAAAWSRMPYLIFRGEHHAKLSFYGDMWLYTWGDHEKDSKPQDTFKMLADNRPDIVSYQDDADSIVVMNMTRLMPLFNLTASTTLASSIFTTSFPPNFDVRFHTTAEYIDVYTAPPESPPDALRPPWINSDKHVRYQARVCGASCFVSAGMTKQVIPAFFGSAAHETYEAMKEQIKDPDIDKEDVHRWRKSFDVLWMGCNTMIQNMAKLFGHELGGAKTTQDVFNVQVETDERGGAEAWAKWRKVQTEHPLNFGMQFFLSSSLVRHVKPIEFNTLLLAVIGRWGGYITVLTIVFQFLYHPKYLEQEHQKKENEYAKALLWRGYDRHARTCSSSATETTHLLDEQVAKNV